MDPVGVVLVLGALAIMLYAFFIGPRQIVKATKKRLSEGAAIPDGVSCHDIAETIKNRIKIKHSKTIQEKTENATLCVDVLCANDITYRVRIDDSSTTRKRLYVSVESPASLNFGKSSDLLKYYQTAERIQDEVLQELVPNYVANRENIKTTIKKVRIVKVCAIGMIIALCAYVIIPAIPQIRSGFNKNSLDNLVAESTLDAYSTTVTIGDAFNKFDPEGEWFTDDTQKTLQDEGMAYIQWHGQCDITTLTQIYHLPISVIFSLSEVPGTDDVYMAVDHISINQTNYYSSDPLEINTVNELVKMLYGIQDQVLICVQTNDSIESATIALASKSGATIDADPLYKEDDSNLQPETSENAGIYDDIVGSWQDIDGYSAYIFIGYGDKTKQTAYAHLSTTREFEVELNSWDGYTASGSAMGTGSEPLYALDISRDGIKLNVGVYVSEDDSYEYITFVPADPATCPYDNPYYT